MLYFQLLPIGSLSALHALIRHLFNLSLIHPIDGVLNIFSMPYILLNLEDKQVKELDWGLDSMVFVLSSLKH